MIALAMINAVQRMPNGKYILHNSNSEIYLTPTPQTNTSGAIPEKTPWWNYLHLIQCRVGR